MPVRRSRSPVRDRARGQPGRAVGRDPDRAVRRRHDEASGRRSSTSTGRPCGDALDRDQASLDASRRGVGAVDRHGRRNGAGPTGRSAADARTSSWPYGSASVPVTSSHVPTVGSRRRVGEADDDRGGRVLDRDQGGRPETTGFGRDDAADGDPAAGLPTTGARRSRSVRDGDGEGVGVGLGVGVGVGTGVGVGAGASPTLRRRGPRASAARRRRRARRRGRRRGRGRDRRDDDELTGQGRVESIAGRVPFRCCRVVRAARRR